MGLTEIVAGILMSGIMLAVVILLLKLIKDIKATMKIPNKVRGLGLKTKNTTVFKFCSV